MIQPQKVSDIYLHGPVSDDLQLYLKENLPLSSVTLLHNFVIFFPVFSKACNGTCETDETGETTENAFDETAVHTETSHDIPHHTAGGTISEGGNQPSPAHSTQEDNNSPK